MRMHSDSLPVAEAIGHLPLARVPTQPPVTTRNAGTRRFAKEPPQVFLLCQGESRLPLNPKERDSYGYWAKIQPASLLSRNQTGTHWVVRCTVSLV